MPQVLRAFEWETGNPSGRRYKFDALITTYEMVLKDREVLQPIRCADGQRGAAAAPRGAGRVAGRERWGAASLAAGPPARPASPHHVPAPPRPPPAAGPT